MAVVRTQMPPWSVRKTQIAMKGVLHETDDHMIWRTGVTGAHGVPDVSQLAWRPDARELAFAGNRTLKRP